MLSGMFNCSNDLNEVVYSKVTQQSYKYTTDDFAPVIANIYSYLRHFPNHWGYFTAQEITADCIVLAPNASGWDDGGVYCRMHYHTGTPNKTM